MGNVQKLIWNHTLVFYYSFFRESTFPSIALAGAQGTLCFARRIFLSIVTEMNLLRAWDFTTRTQ